METTRLLTDGIRFAGYNIQSKLSSHNDGVREVYLAKDDNEKDVVVTVFNLGAERYAGAVTDGKADPMAVTEVRFVKENSGDCAIPDFLGCGTDTQDGHLYVWMAQEYFDGSTVNDTLKRYGAMDTDEALGIAWCVGKVLSKICRFTAGGGHYNISTENILVTYDEENELENVAVTGLSNIGPAYMGKSPVNVRNIDRKFIAPEVSRGIFNSKSDIYSLGMVTLTMLAGYPDPIETDDATIYFTIMDIDMDRVTHAQYAQALWKAAEESLAAPIRLVLRRATSSSPNSRFATADNFMEFISKIYHGHLPVRIARETAATDSRCPSKAGPVPETSTGLEGVKQGIQQAPGDSGKGGLDSVAGMADLKALFRRDFIRILRNPGIAEAYGIKPGNCTLLYGPQGCGKTFIAEKAAQESGLKYKMVRPSELGSVYIHGSQEKIAELFDEAEKNGPMILIFDEFDALVPKRDSDFQGYRAGEVNEMLTQLNNCASRGIYVLATTNRPTLLDPAIMRKGRVDRTIYVSLPDTVARKELFELEIAKRPHGDIDYDALVTATDNYNCSDITFVVEETARQCFEETLDRELSEPLPLTTQRLIDVIKDTQPSVSEDQRKQYLELKAKMDNKEADTRKKVGFISGH